MPRHTKAEKEKRRKEALKKKPKPIKKRGK